MVNLNWPLIVGFIGLATIVYLIERQLNHANSLLGAILQLVETKPSTGQQDRALLQIESELKGIRRAVLDMHNVVKETAASNRDQLRSISDELSELTSEMRAILLIMRPD
jgi:hypothetical protein